EVTERERVEHCGERQTVAHLVVANDAPQFRYRHPLDALGLTRVGRFTDVPCAVGDVAVEREVAHATRRGVRHEELQWPGLPAGLFERLPARTVPRRPPRVEPAGRYLPTPGVGDESVAPQQQDASVRVVDDDAGGGIDRAHDVMLEPAAVRYLDVGERQSEP